MSLKIKSAAAVAQMDAARSKRIQDFMMGILGDFPLERKIMLWSEKHPKVGRYLVTVLGWFGYRCEIQEWPGGRAVFKFWVRNEYHELDV